MEVSLCDDSKTPPAVVVGNAFMHSVTVGKFGRVPVGASPPPYTVIARPRRGRGNPFPTPHPKPFPSGEGGTTLAVTDEGVSFACERHPAKPERGEVVNSEE